MYLLVAKMRRLISESNSYSSPPRHSAMDPLHVEAHPIPKWWSPPPPTAVGHRLIATNTVAAEINIIAKEHDFAIAQTSIRKCVVVVFLFFLFSK